MGAYIMGISYKQQKNTWTEDVRAPLLCDSFVRLCVVPWTYVVWWKPPPGRVGTPLPPVDCGRSQGLELPYVAWRNIWDIMGMTFWKREVSFRISGVISWCFFCLIYYPSGKKTYFSLKGTFEDDFPFSQVGFVSCLEGRIYMSLWMW